MYCLTVSLSQDGLTALSPPCQTMRKVLDNHGVVTGKTAESRINATIRITDSYLDYADLPYHLITSSPHFHGLLSSFPYPLSPASVEIISMHFSFPEGIPNLYRRNALIRTLIQARRMAI